MHQRRIPEGQIPKLTDYVPEKPFHHIMTREVKYMDYVEACEEAINKGRVLRRKKMEEDTYNPETFIQEWQNTPAYLRAESLYAQYLEEAKEIYRQSQATIGKATRQRVTRTLVPA